MSQIPDETFESIHSEDYDRLGFGERVRTIASSLNSLLPEGENVDLKNDDTFEPIEYGLFDFLKDEPEEAPFNLLQYELLFSSGLEFLARALAIRDDALEMQYRASNELVSMYRTGFSLLAKQKMLEESGSRALEVEVSEENAKRAQELATFLEQVKEQLPQDSQVIAYLDSEIEKSRLDGEFHHSTLNVLKSENNSMREELEFERSIFHTLNQRRIERGNALNLTDRIQTLRESFYETMNEAYKRLKAGHASAQQIFSDSEEQQGASFEALFDVFPDLLKGEIGDEVGYADRLFAWAKKSVSDIDRITSFDTELTLEVSLRNESNADVGNEFNEGKFELTKDNFRGFQNLRLISMNIHTISGVTYLDNLPTQKRYFDGHGRHSANIKLPQQNSGVLNESVFLPSIRNHRQASYQGSEALWFRNAKIIGEWSVSISKERNTIPHGETHESQPEDIWIELRVLGTPV
jgi:hypothetical protein